MKPTVIHISPDSEEYTGYTSYVYMGTSTSDLVSYSLQEEKFLQLEELNPEKEYAFPETREERFLTKDLLEYYKKKGYSS